ncbi:MAG: excinuclease ABC subunit UvrC [Lachnospiraceae bacterium]|nr:excinuclease ABC subunit UvrC [Lachnospiraceae bacterium]
MEEELKKLPARPGVYIMHDEKDAIIYVGKAVSLKNRVRQYFQKSRNKGPKIEQMVTKIRRFEYIVTDTELEALVLENNLIKEHSPRYNTMLKDDKTYPFIKVTVGEDYPRIFLTRRMLKDKAKYYGPYTSALAVRDMIDFIRRLYKIRSCSRKLPAEIGSGRPCLNYHIKQCDAPCQGLISREEYRRSVEQAMEFLDGHYEPIFRMLEERMLEASAAMEFEAAATWRDLLTSARQIAQRQKITHGDGEDKDVLAMAAEGTDAIVQVFFIRDGKLIGREHFWVRIGMGEPMGEVLSSFIKQFYAGTPYVPKELMLEAEAADQELLAEWLSSRRGSKVTISVPRRGTKEKLIEMAHANADIVLRHDRERIKREEGRTIGAMKEIADWLGLGQIRRVEAFDISHISGFESVGSMVVFEKGKPKNSDYRKFRLRTIQGVDDYASMREVLTRRFSHGLEEREKLKDMEEFGSFSVFPDLIMMDGGKGQVHVAQEVLESLGLDIPVCGMVKDDHHRTRGLYFRDEELPIDTRSEGFKLITRVQDEAHRFAIEYHRSRRTKEQVHSVLDDIPGIGPARRKALMRAFASMDELRKASVDQLAAIPSMDSRSAESVYRFFHRQNDENMLT